MLKKSDCSITKKEKAAYHEFCRKHGLRSEWWKSSKFVISNKKSVKGENAI